jgi:hypothetical protein
MTRSAIRDPIVTFDPAELRRQPQPVIELADGRQTAMTDQVGAANAHHPLNVIGGRRLLRQVERPVQPGARLLDLGLLSQRGTLVGKHRCSPGQERRVHLGQSGVEDIDRILMLTQQREDEAPDGTELDGVARPEEGLALG